MSGPDCFETAVEQLAGTVAHPVVASTCVIGNREDLYAHGDYEKGPR